jgi:hypothetical protein
MVDFGDESVSEPSSMLLLRTGIAVIAQGLGRKAPLLS